jgi:MFS family permease
LPENPTNSAEQTAERKGWLIVAALFLMLSIIITARNSMGLMMPFWKEDMGWSYKFVATASSIMLITMAVIAPVVGSIIDRLGSRMIYATGMTVIGVVFILCSFMTQPWQLIALFSVVGGAAFAAMAPSLVSTTVAQHFKGRIGLATSIATSGSTGGQFALMPLLAFLITLTSWRQSYLMLGIAVLITAVVVFLLIGRETVPKRPAKGTAGASSVFTTIRVLARTPTFWLLGGGFFICGFTTAGVIKVHLIPYAVSCGFPPVQSATAYGVLSLFSLIGMICYGWLSDRFHRPMLLASCYFVRALTFVMLMYIAGNTPLLYVFAVLFGIFDYATFPIVASLVATHIGRHVMGITMGLIFALHSLGGALGSFMGGWLFEAYARYDWVWIVSVLLALFAGFLTVLIKENREPKAAPSGDAVTA